MTHNTSKTVEVVICKKCNGMGYIYDSKMIDYHKREYDTIKTDCVICGGKGRLIAETTVVYQMLDEI